MYTGVSMCMSYECIEVGTSQYNLCLNLEYITFKIQIYWIMYKGNNKRIL